MSILGRKVSPLAVAGLAALMILAALIPALSGTPTRQITLVARGMAFYADGDFTTPNPTLHVRAGERVRVVLRNEERGVTHDFAVPAVGAAVDLLNWNESGVVVLDAPDTPGTYEYLCQPHRLMMHGLLRGGVTLRGTISTPEGKRRYVRRLFATIADRYDFITVFLSYGQDRRWKRRLIELAAIAPGERALDVACGTGDLLLAAAARARYVVGVDITWRMLQHASRRCAQELRSPGAEEGRASHAALLAGDMMALPFDGPRFDVVTAGYGLRNVPRLEPALREVYRVLAPGGRFLSLDFNRPEHPLVRSAYFWYLTVIGSVVGFILHRDADTYRYIPESIRQFPGAAELARLLADAGFTNVRVVPLLGGLMSIHTATKS